MARCECSLLMSSLMPCRATENGELFGGKVPEEMQRMEVFQTRFMAAAAQDASSDLSATASVLNQAFGMDPAAIDHGDLQEVGSLCIWRCLSAHWISLMLSIVQDWGCTSMNIESSKGMCQVT